VLVDGLRRWGFMVDGPLVVPDGEPVAEALRNAVREQYDVVLTTGGTGLSPSDRTPEATSGVLEREIPGLAEAIRSRGTAAGIPTAALSRGLAGLAGRTLIVNLPGSPGGCRDGLAVLDGVLLHAVDQIHGGDHAPTSSTGSAPTGSAVTEPAPTGSAVTGSAVTEPAVTEPLVTEPALSPGSAPIASAPMGPAPMGPAPTEAQHG
jgi:molybdenum cofactor synthesis domain-containing protein